MRIRFAFAGSFFILVAIAGYSSLSSRQSSSAISNKPLHSMTFFVLTTSFYWILDTSRRRSLNFTLLVCTGVLGVGFELLQSFLPNGHNFDFYDILANVTGSLAALGLSSWYHVRMLGRKRQAKQYQAVPREEDVELGTRIGSTTQESETVSQASTLTSLNQKSDCRDEISRANIDGREGLNNPEDGGDTKQRAD